ncbi:hypothetical protein [Sulfurospirillum arcachonense]|uniref:hypothetical protein n=1 Tax=Sulfurospirillum arcachonense TaxID=57666 RepID=UPI000468ADEF|nr:hypothetical protein [Sulfurospirillum arcachonense]
MFVGWIRKSSFESDLLEFEKTQVIDKKLILNTAFYNQSLCFGAYEDKKLLGFISAYMFEESVYINNFYYQKELSKEVKKRLIKILLTNISEENKSIYILSLEDEKEVFESFGFKSYAKFSKATYSGKSGAFNFTNATAKSISNENFKPTLKRVDEKTYKEDRFDYVTKSMFKSSSLLLSTQRGYQHSYALNKNIIKLSPWIMDPSWSDDAEKLLRGVIYHRGLKKIIAFIPSEVKEITDLYLTYNFELTEGYNLMYKNEKPEINIQMIYGL